MLAAFTFQPIQVHNDKLTRALPLVARSEQGKLAIVRGGWNLAFVDQLCSFPEGQHDDMVDAVSGGLTMLSEYTPFVSESVPWGNRDRGRGFWHEKKWHIDRKKPGPLI
jgi:hypothetical protein